MLPSSNTVLIICVLGISLLIAYYLSRYNELLEKEKRLNSLDIEKYEEIMAKEDLLRIRESARYHELIQKELLLHDINARNFERKKRDKEFFDSAEGQRSAAAAFKFFRAFIMVDTDTMRDLLIEREIREWYTTVGDSQTGDFCDVHYFDLKQFRTISPNEVGISYEFASHEDSYTYMGVGLMLIDGEWKVSDFSLQK